MTTKQRRLTWMVFCLLSLGVAGILILLAARDSVVFFFSPSELVQRNIAPNQQVRIGGLVAIGSVHKDDQIVRFVVTDMVQDIPIVFTGVLPDLFRESRGVVVEGKFGTDGTFYASVVLAKHNETYMPRDVAEILKKNKTPQTANTTLQHEIINRAATTTIQSSQ